MHEGPDTRTVERSGTGQTRVTHPPRFQPIAVRAQNRSNARSSASVAILYRKRIYTNCARPVNPTVAAWAIRGAYRVPCAVLPPPHGTPRAGGGDSAMPHMEVRLLDQFRLATLDLALQGTSPKN